MSDDITIAVNGEDGAVVSRNAGIRFVGEDALVRVWPSFTFLILRIVHRVWPRRHSNFLRQLQYWRSGMKSPRSQIAKYHELTSRDSNHSISLLSFLAQSETSESLSSLAIH